MFFNGVFELLDFFFLHGSGALDHLLHVFQALLLPVHRVLDAFLHVVHASLDAFLHIVHASLDALLELSG
jgi:hypothetical protein